MTWNYLKIKNLLRTRQPILLPAPVLIYNFPPLVIKWYDKLLLFHTAKKMYRKNKYDLIHFRSYISAKVGLQFKRQFNAKFLFDMRSFWANEKADGGACDRVKQFWNNVYLFFKKKEKEFLQNADYTNYNYLLVQFNPAEIYGNPQVVYLIGT